MNFNTISMLVRRHARTNIHMEIYLHAQTQYVKMHSKNVLISMWINVFLKPYGWVNCCNLVASRLMGASPHWWVTFPVISSAVGMAQGMFWLCRQEHHSEGASNSFWQKNMFISWWRHGQWHKYGSRVDKAWELNITLKVCSYLMSVWHKNYIFIGLRTVIGQFEVTWSEL